MCWQRRLCTKLRLCPVAPRGPRCPRVQRAKRAWPARQCVANACQRLHATQYLLLLTVPLWPSAAPSTSAGTTSCLHVPVISHVTVVLQNLN